MMLALALTCWLIGIYAMFTEPAPFPFYGWMLAALFFAFAAT